MCESQVKGLHKRRKQNGGLTRTFFLYLHQSSPKLKMPVQGEVAIEDIRSVLFSFFPDFQWAIGLTKVW